MICLGEWISTSRGMQKFLSYLNCIADASFWIFNEKIKATAQFGLWNGMYIADTCKHNKYTLSQKSLVYVSYTINVKADFDN